ncbi:Transcription initiation factor TFIID subunit [Klebsormidium nitens]|uniref:Transcription initiation factor TFIID subunit 11 n=1 Tax=Klebsormidium nitens TaxID=105231 RepID=A0A1Y1HYG3_KLENI|nr:Transcription initiation factor TFIID subunit [Klebsormidium nitens]|eukprot:GAQ81577.1 Transcription initiation factor TFIID subunit [Klebsormidium nitens]
MKREATGSPDDGQKKEKRKYIRKPKPPAATAPAPSSEVPASSLMEVVWGGADAASAQPGAAAGEKASGVKSAKGKGGGKGAADGKKSKQGGESEGDGTRDGGASRPMEKSSAGPSRLGSKAPNLRTDDDPEDDEEEADFGFGRDTYQKEDPERMQQIFASMTEEQMRRYECFRRSGLSRPNLKRLMQSVSGSNVSIPMSIVMGGLSKMFVGDLVETAREVMTEWNETGPIRPTHIREALRRLKSGGKVPVRSRPLLFM